MLEAGFRRLFPGPLPLIGVVHLPPFPGYPATPGVEALVAHALADVAALEALGYDGVLLENEHDRPHRVAAARETIAVMTRVAAEAVRAAGRIHVGVEILLNDPCASLAVATAAGARFIRTDYFVDRMARDEHGGEMAIDAAGLLDYRRALAAAGPRGVLILADIQVKYARMLEPRPLAQSAAAASAAGADAVIVTGELTGRAPDAAAVRAAAAGAAGRPVLVGSGLTAANAAAILAHAAGAIVGTGIMTDGVVDRAKAAALRTAVELLRRAR